MSSSDEEEEREESEEEEEENSDDSDSEYRHSQDDDENFVREQNVKALRDGLPLSKIRYASVLSNLKPPEPDEVILKRHFAPLVPGGALQTGTFLVCSLVCFLARSEEGSRFWIFERFFFVSRPKRRVFWVPTFEKKKHIISFSLCFFSVRRYCVVYISILTILCRKRFLFLSYSWVTKSDSRSENIHPVRIEAQSRVAENYPVRRGCGRYRAPRRRRRVGVVARRG